MVAFTAMVGELAKINGGHKDKGTWPWRHSLAHMVLKKRAERRRALHHSTWTLVRLSALCFNIPRPSIMLHAPSFYKRRAHLGLQDLPLKHSLSSVLHRGPQTRREKKKKKRFFEGLDLTRGHGPPQSALVRYLPVSNESTLPFLVGSDFKSPPL